MTPRDFSEFDLSDTTLDALEARGMTSTFPVQDMVLEDALAGKDVLVKSPTGSGKTLAFAIPIIEQLHEDHPAPAALVLVPTRELAVQVMEEFQATAAGSGIRCEPVYGGTKVRQQATVAARAHVVIATPGRLEDIASRRMIDLDEIRILVLDEADRMLDMGFQPQVDRIVRRLPTDRQTMFFSATLDGRVGRVAKRYTRDAVQHEYKPPSEDIGSIEHRFMAVNRGTKSLVLAELLQEESEGLTLVFVRTKRGADLISRDLRQMGVTAAAMHGDMSQADREKTLRKFEKGQMKNLIATDVAARGLDLDDIGRVINFDPPNDETDYTHRVGRTGRAGRTGIGITLVQPDEQRQVSMIVRRLGLEKAFTEGGFKMMAPRMVYTSRNRGGRLGAPRGRGGRR